VPTQKFLDSTNSLLMDLGNGSRTASLQSVICHDVVEEKCGNEYLVAH
jgi:hypothetical protein